MIYASSRERPKNKEGAKKGRQMMENAPWETSVEGRLRKRGEGGIMESQQQTMSFDNYCRVAPLDIVGHSCAIDSTMGTTI